MDFPVVISGKNVDLFEFTELSKDWSVDFIQLGGGSFLSSIYQVLFPEFHLAYVHFNSSVKQEGRSPKGYWSFAFADDIELFWRNKSVAPKSIIVYAPDSEINAVNNSDFDVMIFSIEESLLFQFAKQTNADDLMEKLDSGLLSCSVDLWDTLRNTILSEITEYNSNENHSNKFQFLDSFTLSLLELLKTSKPSIKKVSNVTRLQLLTDVEHYIQDNISEKITIPELVKCCNVSERTLLYTFKKRFKIGPKAYIKVLKLNCVYRILHGDTQGKTISNIARQFGFWHMGQFHADYKAFFGELPSETVAKEKLRLLKS